MDMIQDWMIINKIKMGDPDAWDILVHKYYDSVYFYCVRRCYGDCDIASDLTQDIFLKLDLLIQVGLDDVKNKKIRKYSGGMKQRLGIAQAMINNPEILILDEPTVGLDPKERVKFRKLISSFASEKIVLLSTHIVSEIEYILYSKDAFFFHSFFINIGFIFIFQLLIRVGMQLYCFIYIKHWKF